MPDPQLRDLKEEDLAAATELLTVALPYDRCNVVAKEKLFGGNHRRQGYNLGAFSPAGDLLGVVSMAGRWIKLLAVHPSVQRRGIGTKLLGEARAMAKKAGTTGKLRVGDHPGNYLSPGLDERYEEGQAFFKARGFVEAARVLNLRAQVTDNPIVTAERLSLQTQTAAKSGYTIRRATSVDVEPLLTMVSQSFAPVWSHEVALALGPSLGQPASSPSQDLPEGPTVHVALDGDGAVVAFAAHDGNNRGLGWFGPMGTLDKHRGHGLGEALLLACLLDVFDRPDGGVIAWVGPVGFYQRASGAIPDRRFVVFEEQ